jgi:TonB family protein
MSTSQIWPNILAYALQIGLLVALGAVAPTVLRLRTPRARLLYWQALLVACVGLPWVQPWRQEVVSLSNANVLTTASRATANPSVLTPAAAAFTPAHGPIPFATIVLWLLLAGFVTRLLSLGIGLARLAGYRRRGRELDSDPVFRMATPGSARWLVSDEIAGPVTFGWRDPVVLLPARFPLLRAELREAILCHELLHVERRDWMFTVAEELVRAAFWFHPAIWWVLGEIQLAREQTVDQAVIEVTYARGPYVDALLVMAGTPDVARGTLDLVPAPLFLRKRHLKQRVFGLLRVARVSPLSRRRVVATQAGVVLTIAAACWFSSGVFPLSAAPQFVVDAEGVTVDTGGAKLTRRTPVEYPFEALQSGVQGEVVIKATVDADGTVSDKTVVRCAPELCSAAVDSLPQWQFDRREAGTTREIRIDFARPAGITSQPAIDMSPQPGLARAVLLTQSIRPPAPGQTVAKTVPHVPQSIPTFVSRTVSMDGTYVMLVSPVSASAAGQPLNYVRIAGLSMAESAQLSSRLPVHAGDVWSAATASIVSQVVRDFNPQLEVDLVDYVHPRTFSLWIGPNAPSGNQPGIAMPPLPEEVYAAGGGVTPPAVLSKFDPEYTDAARSARVSGAVTLSVVVAADGTPQNIQVIGPLDPGLDQAAADALAKWHFRPGAKDGVPVNVQARVEMSFRAL